MERGEARRIVLPEIDPDGPSFFVGHEYFFCSPECQLSFERRRIRERNRSDKGMF